MNITINIDDINDDYINNNNCLHSLHFGSVVVFSTFVWLLCVLKAWSWAAMIRLSVLCSVCPIINIFVIIVFGFFFTVLLWSLIVAPLCWLRA